MKRDYFPSRIFLLALAFGLASVSFFNELFEKWTGVSVNLPQVQSKTPIIATPRYCDEIPYVKGSHFAETEGCETDTIWMADKDGGGSGSEMEKNRTTEINKQSVENNYLSCSVAKLLNLVPKVCLKTDF